jgi:hypothetical protein
MRTLRREPRHHADVRNCKIAGREARRLQELEMIIASGLFSD